jgi:hypothetical protein
LGPEDPGALKSEVEAWLGEPRHDSHAFNPRLNLVPQKIAIMQIQPNAIIAATAEAVLRSNPGQTPWHVTDWSQKGSVANIEFHGDTWAGSSSHFMEVSYLIRKSLLNLPGISDVLIRWKE